MRAKAWRWVAVFGSFGCVVGIGAGCSGRGSAAGEAEGGSADNVDSGGTCLTGTEAGSNKATAIAVGTAHACALTDQGGVLCWGYNISGQLGNGTNNNSRTPVRVMGLSSRVLAIAAGQDNTCAITAGGGVQCWGFNADGQLGNGTTMDSPVPTQVTSLSAGVKALSVGYGNVACAVTGGGGVDCWGSDLDAVLGDNGTDPNMCTVYSPLLSMTLQEGRCEQTPVAVPGLDGGATAVSVDESACALLQDGTATCWGGPNADAGSRNPAPVAGLTGLTAITTDGLAVTSDGTLEVWSKGGTPAPLAGLAEKVISASGSSGDGCAVTMSGGVVCWGGNFDGKLGDGEVDGRASSATPVQVTGLTSGFTSVAAGSNFSCALAASGKVMCWGDNMDGQLGDGCAASSSVPVEVVGF